MAKYLLDVNMTNYFGEWQPPLFQHVVELNRRWLDSSIWEYARNKDMTILTKDYDFYDRIISDAPPPRVIHFRLGNMKRKDFQAFATANWEKIRLLSEQNKLVIVYQEEILTLE